MNCIYCGRQLMPSASFCNYCGKHQTTGSKRRRPLRINPFAIYLGVMLGLAIVLLLWSVGVL